MKNEGLDELMLDFLSKSYPITRIRLSNKFHGEVLPNSGMKTKGNFKRTIIINTNLIFKISDTDERYRAIQHLTRILCRVFWIHQDIALPIIKKHLHIK